MLKKKCQIPNYFDLNVVKMQILQFTALDIDSYTGETDGNVYGATTAFLVHIGRAVLICENSIHQFSYW